MDEKTVNFTRYQPGQKKGHYESFFQRANHPTEPKAFWIRYTIFSPDNLPEKAIGELWAIYFDGTTGQHISVKKEVAIENCVFEQNKFFVQIDDAILEQWKLSGIASSNGNSLDWDLSYSANSEPLFLLPQNLYSGGFPKAKALVGQPFAIYNGSLNANGEHIEIKDWIGSQNHNWGIRHTDHYAWGQVAGFDNSPDSFLEIATGRLKFGPVWTPFFTLMVLRHNGQEYRLNSILQSVKSKGKFGYFHWNFFSEIKGISIEGTIKAEKKDFVCLNYYNPPGGIKYCLNTKIAACSIKVKYKNKSGEPVEEVLDTKHRAAFEILTDDENHGLKS